MINIYLPTKEEEKELWRTHSVDKLLDIYYSMHIVMSRIWRNKLSVLMDTDDISQISLIALYECLIRFSPDKNMSFRSYYFTKGKLIIIDYLRKYGIFRRSRCTPIINTPYDFSEKKDNDDDYNSIHKKLGYLDNKYEEIDYRLTRDDFYEYIEDLLTKGEKKILYTFIDLEYNYRSTSNLLDKDIQYVRTRINQIAIKLRTTLKELIPEEVYNNYRESLT